MGVVTLAAHPHAPFIARTASSPVLPETLPAKHRVVPAHKGSRNWEDGGVRDGRGENYGGEQSYGASWDTNHALAAPTHAGWALGPPRGGNQSPPL